MIDSSSAAVFVALMAFIVALYCNTTKTGQLISRLDSLVHQVATHEARLYLIEKFRRGKEDAGH